MSSALRDVWELPELRDHILWYLRNRNIVPLLTVNKQFFQYGVERIYRDLEYVDYKDLKRKFKNSPRTELYCDAVLTVDITKDYNIPQPPNEWVYLFGIFPNASTITCDSEILRRTVGSECIEYFYSHLRMLQLVQPRESKAKLEWDTEHSKDLPKDTNLERWRETTHVHLYLYGHFPPLLTIREREKIDLYRLIKSRMRKKHLELLTVYSVTLDYQWGIRQILNLIRHSESSDRYFTVKFKLEELSSFQIDQDFIDVVHSQLDTLRTIRVHTFIHNPQPFGLIDLMGKFPWQGLKNLNQLHVTCHRYLTPGSSSFSTSTFDIPRPQYHKLPGYGLTYLGICILYPDGPVLCKEKLADEIKVVKGLARCVAQLGDPQKLPYHSPWIEFRFKAANGEDEFAKVNKILQQTFIEEINGCLGMKEESIPT